MRRPSEVNSSAPWHRSYRTFICNRLSSRTHCGFTYCSYSRSSEGTVTVADISSLSTCVTSNCFRTFPQEINGQSGQDQKATHNGGSRRNHKRVNHECRRHCHEQQQGYRIAGHAIRPRPVWLTAAQ